MEKEDLEEYLKKLENFDKVLSNPNGDIDDELILEIETVLKKFSEDINEPIDEEVISVKIKKLHPDAKIPQYAIDGDVGMDLTCISFSEDENGNFVYGTGLSMEIPKGYAGFIFPRSSISKYELDLSNSVGVIDPGYRGEIMCKFKPTPYISRDMDYISNRNYVKGDRIAQIVIMPRPKIIFIESEELSRTERSEGGYGSTGK